MVCRDDPLTCGYLEYCRDEMEAFAHATVSLNLFSLSRVVVDVVVLTAFSFKSVLL